MIFLLIVFICLLTGKFTANDDALAGFGLAGFTELLIELMIFAYHWNHSL